MQTKTVLMITPFASPNIGGAEAHVDKLRSYLIGRGWQVILATYQPLTTPVKAPAFEAGDGFITYRMPWFGRKGWFNTLERWPFPFVFAYLFPGLLWISLRAAWENCPRIRTVHAHGLAAAVVARILKAFFGFRIVASTHAIYGLDKRPVLARILKWLFRGFDFVLTVGEPALNELVRAGVEPERIGTHANWVDLRIFVPLWESGRYAGYERRALFVGRLIPKKGVGELVEAARQLTNWTFSIVGAGPLLWLDHLPNVIWVGRARQAELIEAYKKSVATILPSQYDEGFSAVVCESLACGTPVMVPRRGVLSHILDQSVATFIEPTTEGIVKALREWKPKNREQCRAFAEQHFSNRNAEKIERALLG